MDEGSEPHLVGDAPEGGTLDKMAACRGEKALTLRRIGMIEDVGTDSSENSIAEVFEALVVADGSLLCIGDFISGRSFIGCRSFTAHRLMAESFAVEFRMTGTKADDRCKRTAESLVAYKQQTQVVKEGQG